MRNFFKLGEIMTEDAKPIPDNAGEFCLTSSYGCKKLFIPRFSSSRRGLTDKCLVFDEVVDRDSRQRPERCKACLLEWPIAGGAK